MTDKEYRNDFIKALGGVAMIFLFLTAFICSGCEFMRKLDKSATTDRNDSTNVKKQTEVSSSVDTSKTKTASTKETVYYPQPIIVPGKDGETKIVFVPQTVKETGTEEKQNFNYENYMKNVLDSMTIAQLKSELNKKSETEGSVLGMGFWIGIAIVGVVLIGLLLALVHFKNQIVNIKNLLPKN
jgi:uncharacterized membrane protein